MDVHEWSECPQGVDLRECVEESILFVRGQPAVILAGAEVLVPVIVVVLTRGWRLVVLLARLEAAVFVGMRDIDWWTL
jgi:hypothetical protein